jgi:alkanesulfonate monooxygenase SsuD/methylene tetrahydromethanopterin reductase-like flavin-dependent oxidoreductase (luciferase family)
MKPMRFGIILPNRGVVLGLTTVKELLAQADAAEACPLIDSVWVGDDLFVNRRVDSLTLLAAIAGRTERVRLGPACMGSFALREPRVFAYEWASLDVISNGRTLLVVCSGGGANSDWAAEEAIMGIDPKTRRRRMVEHMQLLRHLWTTDGAPFEGQYFRFSGATLEPKPVQNPCPIWLGTNGVKTADGDAGASEIAVNRVGKHADGWMTIGVTPEGFAKTWARIHAIARDAGRDASAFGNVLFHHIGLAPDRDAALNEAARFLAPYYGGGVTPDRLLGRGAYGPARDCIDQLRRYRDVGCERVAIRLCGTGALTEQLDRLAHEVLCKVNG